ncbi:MAG: hypothetical protein SFY69_09255 [Planctomycetota bacterium]|nr:hypothetical protein [Planctomycetota bacterium]
MASPRGTFALATALFSGVVASSATGQTFDLLGLGPAGFSSRAYGLSDDGRVASGGSPGNPAQGFWWTRADGRRDVGVVLGLPFGSYSYGISGDGGTLVGQYGIDAYRWTIGSPSLDILGRLPGYQSAFAQDANHDGSIVVGRSESFDGAIGQAFRCTSTTGLVGLGYTQPGHVYSEAAAISRDGTTIVGHSRGGGYSEAFAWREDVGMQVLAGLDSTNEARAYGTNFDGRVVVGDTRYGAGNQGAVMWISGQPVALGFASGYSRSAATAVDDSGSVVVGYVSAPFQTAAIWTPGRGMEPLSAYLAFHGVQVPAGVNLLTATAVSADGSTIVGYTGLNGGPVEGFIVSIPSPNTIFMFVLAFSATARRARR